MSMLDAFNQATQNRQNKANVKTNTSYYWKSPDGSGCVYRNGHWNRVDCLFCAIRRGWANTEMHFRSPAEVTKMIHDSNRRPTLLAHMPKMHLALVQFHRTEMWTVGYRKALGVGQNVYEIPNLPELCNKTEGEELLSSLKTVYQNDYHTEVILNVK